MELIQPANGIYNIVAFNVPGDLTIWFFCFGDNEGGIYLFFTNDILFLTVKKF